MLQDSYFIEIMLNNLALKIDSGHVSFFFRMIIIMNDGSLYIELFT